MSAASLVPLLVLLSAGVAEAQIRFLAQPRLPMPPSVASCSRIATGDVNGDGWPDLVCANMGGSGEQNTLYLNDGHGGFTDVTATHLPPVVDSTMAVALGDIDGDGDLDLFFANATYLNPVGSRLCINDGTGHFTDVGNTQLPVLAQSFFCARFVDFDGDGDLDLVARQRLLRNDGTGSFTDISVMQPSGAFFSQGIGAGDFDGDGDVDLVYTNSFDSTIVPPVLWINNGNGTFTDASANLPVRLIYALGDPAVGDVDGDGDLDLFVACHGRQSQLWLNNGRAVFTDATATNLPAVVESTWTAMFADFDGDSDLDVVVITGALGGANRVLVNNGSGVFAVDAAAAPLLGMQSQGGAITDIDGDSDLDVVVGNVRGSPGLWLNLQRQVHASQPPVLGGSYAVDYHARPGSNQAALVIPLISTAALQPPMPVPGIGLLGLQSPVSLPIGSTVPATGRYTLTLAVPNWPSLSGLELFHQGVIVDGALIRLTGTLRDRIQ